MTTFFRGIKETIPLNERNSVAYPTHTSKEDGRGIQYIQDVFLLPNLEQVWGGAKVDLYG